jgi:hypothetical protein
MLKSTVCCGSLLLFGVSLAHADATAVIEATKLNTFCVYQSHIYSLGAALCVDSAQRIICQMPNSLLGGAAPAAFWQLETAGPNSSCAYNPGVKP